MMDLINAVPKCSCRPGFVGDGRSPPRGNGCTNVDECATGEAICSQLCVDYPGGYTCQCYDGYRSDDGGVNCYDIDECMENRHTCSHLCTNLPGAYACSCPAGYNLSSDGVTCSDIDECVLNPQLCHHVCVNMPGSYICACDPGYEISATNLHECVDTNECLNGINNNPQKPACATDGSQTCTNTEGAFKCACLEPQWVPANSYTDNNLVCDDVDECAIAEREDRSLCPKGKECRNLRGSYECECEEGFEFSQQTYTCLDIDECAAGINTCSQQCVNLAPGYACECYAGYRMINGACLDVDECAEGISECEYGCQNTDGSFMCTCPDGLKLSEDGAHCVDVDECVTGICAAPCLNLWGSYMCACDSGYYSNDRVSLPVEIQINAREKNFPLELIQQVKQYFDSIVTCLDVNECDLPNACPNNLLCENTMGSYTCKCPQGYQIVSGKQNPNTNIHTLAGMGNTPPTEYATQDYQNQLITPSQMQPAQQNTLTPMPSMTNINSLLTGFGLRGRSLQQTEMLYGLMSSQNVYGPPYSPDLVCADVDECQIALQGNGIIPCPNSKPCCVNTEGAFICQRKKRTGCAAGSYDVGI